MTTTSAAVADAVDQADTALGRLQVAVQRLGDGDLARAHRGGWSVAQAIPDLGTMTVVEWTPLIVGHVVGHVDQAFEIMRDRGFAPEGT